MKIDFFQDRKCVHVKLEKDTHTQLKIKLFQKGVSIQEVLDEFARLVGAGDPRAMAIVDGLIKRQLNDLINSPVRVKIGRRRLKFGKDPGLGELDSESLYSLISDQEKAKKAKKIDDDQ